MASTTPHQCPCPSHSAAAANFNLQSVKCHKCTKCKSGGEKIHCDVHLTMDCAMCIRRCTVLCVILCMWHWTTMCTWHFTIHYIRDIEPCSVHVMHRIVHMRRCTIHYIRDIEPCSVHVRMHCEHCWPCEGNQRLEVGEWLRCWETDTGGWLA